MQKLHVYLGTRGTLSLVELDGLQRAATQIHDEDCLILSLIPVTWMAWLMTYIRWVLALSVFLLTSHVPLLAL